MCLAKQTGIQTGSICRSGIRFSNAHKPHQQNPSNNVIAVNNLTAVETWQDFVVLSWFKHRIRAHQSGTSDCATAHSTQGLQLGRTTSLKDTKKHCRESLVQDWCVCDTMWNNPPDPITKTQHKDKSSAFTWPLCACPGQTWAQPHSHTVIPCPGRHTVMLWRGHLYLPGILVKAASCSTNTATKEKLWVQKQEKKKKKRTTLIPKKQTQKSPYLASST